MKNIKHMNEPGCRSWTIVLILSLKDFEVEMVIIVSMTIKIKIN